MKLRVVVVALLAALVATALIAPRPLSIAHGRPFSTVRSATTAVTLNDKADGSGDKDTLVPNPQLGSLLSGSMANIALPAALTDATHPPLMIYLDHNGMEDLWIAITWSQ